MPSRKTSIVVTTIFEPDFIAGYIENVRAHGRSGHVDLIVIVDRKTPASMPQACAEYRAKGNSVHCPSLEEQEEFLSKFPTIAGRIPYNSDNRRNVGFLMALDRGADVL